MRHPTSCQALESSLLVGTDTGLLVRFNSRDLIPERTIDLAAIVGLQRAQTWPCPVHILNATNTRALVACNGVYVEIKV